MITHRKSQIQSNVILYVMVGIITVVLLIAAVKAISTFKQRQNELLVRQFEEDVSEAIATIEYGAIEETNLQLPSDVTEVCFVDLSKRSEILKSPLIRRIPIMKNSIESGVRKNVFMVAGTEVKESIYGGDICSDHYPYYNCIKVSGNVLNMYLQGKGRCALVVQEIAPCLEFDTDPVTTTEDLSIKATAAELEIPSGTTIDFPGSETKICMEPVLPPSPLDQDPDGLISEVYSLTPEGTVLGGSSFTMSYYPELLDLNINPESIKIKYYDSESDIWTKISSPTVETRKKTITNQITELKKHAVFGPEPPVSVIKIIEQQGPPVVHYLEPYIFGIGEETWFDGSDSYDDDGEMIITAYEWDFGDETPGSSNPQPTHMFTEFGFYTVSLTVTDSDDNTGTETAEVSIINKNNIKDTAKYTDIIFLISKTDSWRNILQPIPLAMWRGNIAEGGYGKAEKPYLTYDGTMSVAELTKIMSEYSATKAAFFNTVPPALSGLEYVTRISQTSYFNYWSGYEDIVAVDYNNRDAALMAALFASAVNAPIIFINNANKATYSTRIQDKNVYTIGTIDQPTVDYITGKAASVTPFTLAQVSVPPKNPYEELYTEIIPSNALS